MQGLGFIREEYLNWLKTQSQNSLVKVLVGQRRVGKSYVLKQYIDFLINKDEVPAKNILYLNFEFFELNEFKNINNLEKLINHYLKTLKPDSKKEIYLIFDEIQELQSWEILINSYAAKTKLLDYKFQIIITGSNSKLISSELGSQLTGRFTSREVSAFSFAEYLMAKDLEANKNNFLKYIQRSHLPELIFSDNEDFHRSYLSDLTNSILFKDIAQRYKVQNHDLLERLFIFIVNNIANLSSINSILKKLKSFGYSSNINTISTYLKYLQNTYLIKAIERFDLNGKKILEGEKKYYLNDIGLRFNIFSSYEKAWGKVLENYVFNYLTSKGYKVHIGKLKNLEIDFVAEKNSEIKYFQVAYLLHDESVMEREFRNLEKIKDNWNKYVISLDDLNIGSMNGIKHIQAWNLNSYL